MKKILRLGLVAGMTIVLAGTGILLFRAELFGSGNLESWIGRQIVGMVNHVLVPRIDYKTLQYSPPYRVTMTDVSLTAPGDLKLLKLVDMRLELAERPKMGEPVIFKEVHIGDGLINLQQDPKTGKLRGFDPLIEERFSNTFSPSGSSQEFRLSNVLELRRISLKSVNLRYDDGSGQPAMELKGLTTAVTIAPEGADKEGGWYDLDLNFGRGTLFHVTFKGQFNIDTFDVDCEEATLAIEINQETITNLPPQLQQLLTQVQARGDLDAGFRGQVSLSDPLAASLTGRVQLRNFDVTFGDYHLPIRSLDASVKLENRKLMVPQVKASMLNGALTAAVEVDLGQYDAGTLPGRATWEMHDVQLREAVKGYKDERTRLAGRTTSTGVAMFDLMEMPRSLRGDGRIIITEGNLLGVPLMSELAQIMKIGFGRLVPELNDKASVKFELTSAGAQITDSEVTTTLMAARARGIVGYDMNLDLKVNAGPLEKIQSLFGKLGRTIGKVTDNLVSYRVTGPAWDPTVAVGMF